MRSFATKQLIHAFTEAKEDITYNELIDACSNALDETRGRGIRISERTIRDDLRVMRSDILGFNAPIVQKDRFILLFRSDDIQSCQWVSQTPVFLMQS